MSSGRQIGSVGSPDISPVILAAGRGTRFGGDAPKSLATIEGKPLLAHACGALSAAGFEQVNIVVGHRSEMIQEWLAGQALPIDVRLIHNPDYAKPSIHSLHCAVRTLSGPLLVIEGDLIYDPRILSEMRADGRPDLVPCGPRRQPRPWLIERDADERVRRWGYDLPGCDVELIGIYKLSRALCAALLQHEGVEYWDPLLDLGFPIFSRWCEHRWTEVDTPDDLLRARQLWGAARDS